MNAAYLGHKETYPGLIDDLLSETPAMIAVDIETIDLKDRTIVGIGIATGPTDAIYFPILPEPSAYLDHVIDWLLDERITKIWHNALFDLDILSRDPQYDGILDIPVLDTLVMAQLAGYPAKLSELALCCGTTAQDMKLILKNHKAKTTLELPEQVLAQKCCLDVQATFAAYLHLEPLIDMSYLREEMKLIPIIIRMQQRGLKIDHTVRETIGAELQEQIDFYFDICKDEGFNPASPMQVGYVLLKRGNWQVAGYHKKTTKKANYKTGEDILKKLDDPLAHAVLGYRHVAKQKSTYIDPIAELNRVYTQFSFETATRRLASAKFNLQNWPKHLRRMIRGPFSGFDFSQQELRVLAYVSGDKRMQDIFNRGEDIHLATAGFMFGVPLDQVTKELRFKGKTANFSMIYGSEDKALIPLRERWFAAFPQAADWIRDIQDFAMYHLKVPTVMGAWLYIKDEGDIAAIRRKGTDYVCQGSGSEITKRAMIRCGRLPMVLQIHDEVIFNGDVRDELVKLDLEHLGPFETPIELKYMEHWQ